jgi:serine/threonine-protein kinase HipA
MNGERVGLWTLPTRGAETFVYAPEWLVSDGARPISLSMPLGPPGAEFRGPVVTSFFDNLLPESSAVRARIQARFHAPSSRAFDLLTEIGRDCVGAIQLLPEKAAPERVRRIQGTRLTDAGVAKALAGSLDGTHAFGANEGGEFRISLAGMQEKTALLQHQGRWWLPTSTTPTTHILKLPIGMGPQGIDLGTSVENEWLCGSILHAYGTEVAPSTMETFGDYRVLVVERFDRRLASDKSWIVRLPQEDLCQATATPAANKYQADGGPGILSIMKLLLGSTQPDLDRRKFLRAQMLFWLLCAIDGHAKNFSIFLEPGGGYRLTPLYDVLSAYPVLGKTRGKLSPERVTMAMAVEGTRRHYRWSVIQRRHWEETARRCGLAAALPSIAAELIERAPEVVKQVAAKLPQDFPDSVAAPIFKGLDDAAKTLRR